VRIDDGGSRDPKILKATPEKLVFRRGGFEKGKRPQGDALHRSRRTPIVLGADDVGLEKSKVETSIAERIRQELRQVRGESRVAMSREPVGRCAHHQSTGARFGKNKIKKKKKKQKKKKKKKNITLLRLQFLSSPAGGKEQDHAPRTWTSPAKS